METSTLLSANLPAPIAPVDKVTSMSATVPLVISDDSMEAPNWVTAAESLASGRVPVVSLPASRPEAIWAFSHCPEASAPVVTETRSLPKRPAETAPVERETSMSATAPSTILAEVTESLGGVKLIPVSREPSTAGSLVEPSRRTSWPAALKALPWRVTEEELSLAESRVPRVSLEASRPEAIWAFSHCPEVSAVVETSTRLSPNLPAETAPVEMSTLLSANLPAPTAPVERETLASVAAPAASLEVVTAPSAMLVATIPVRSEPSTTGSLVVPSSRTSWPAALKALPWRVTEEESRARGLPEVPVPVIGALEMTPVTIPERDEPSPMNFVALTMPETLTPVEMETTPEEPPIVRAEEGLRVPAIVAFPLKVTAWL